MSCLRMQIGNHEIAFIFILHANVITHGSKIISEMKETCWPDTAHYYLFLLFHAAAKIRIVMSCGGRVVSHLRVLTIDRKPSTGD